ncbi:MAG TPA: hypothetical protein PK629_12600 [Oscillospiraceae bacterium]|mgnify:CR=1 FL=1|nr:hypothetical protein [Oscillospiraceae bacterium]HPK36611.1 hypothetical protein [Oscillospiraceae bacterium]HPR76883.1 hypothetical protein [Oscillospiraceae bacterium]
MKKVATVVLLLFLSFSVLGCSSGLYKGPPKRGTVSDGVYTNDYFKLSFTIPEGWNFYSDEDFYNLLNYSAPTDEDLANTQMGYTDAYIYKTAEPENRISITFYTGMDDSLTDEQIRNRLVLNASDIELGDIELIKIGEIDYAMISGTTSDGALNYYYTWSKEVFGDHRPIFFIHLNSGDSVYDILDNFSQITD